MSVQPFVIVSRGPTDIRARCTTTYDGRSMVELRVWAAHHKYGPTPTNRKITFLQSEITKLVQFLHQPTTQELHLMGGIDVSATVEFEQFKNHKRKPYELMWLFRQSNGKHKWNGFGVKKFDFKRMSQRLVQLLD